MIGNQIRLKELNQMKTIMFGLFMMFSVSVTSWSEESYILTDLLDIDQIRDEEQLSDDAQVARIYIFLAVWNGTEYETYTTNGQSDPDSDGEEAAKEPNDLEEYQTDTTPISLSSAINIDEEDYTCYISDLPNFSTLFPEDEDPFATSSMIDVQTSATQDDNKRLTGTKSIPVVSDAGDQKGVERFIAFYNKRGESEKEGEDKNDVLSFGFIEVRMLQSGM